jgi:hypothetical protein
MKGSVYIFINYWQAARCGHLGWGFLIKEPDVYYFGSTDHLLRTPYWNLFALYRYMHVAPQSPTDWWARTGSKEEMLWDMKVGHHVQYEAYKVISVNEAEPLAAQKTAEDTGFSGWAVLVNNCLHQTYKILDSYGAGGQVPHPLSPITHRIPRLWFDKIEKERHWL